MGHLYHGYVTNNQREIVPFRSLWGLLNDQNSRRPGTAGKNWRMSSKFAMKLPKRTDATTNCNLAKQAGKGYLVLIYNLFVFFFKCFLS